MLHFWLKYFSSSPSSSSSSSSSLLSAYFSSLFRNHFIITFILLITVFLSINLSFSHSQLTSNHNGHLRFKRSISREHYLKVMVVYDYTMFKHHSNLHPKSSNVDDHIRHYILSLISTVANIYSDPSIGNHLHVSVVEIKRLSRSERLHRNRPQHTLEQFCKWQKLNKHESQNNYNVAIFLTRKICLDDSSCDTLGITRRNSMCNPFWSCAVVKDNGLAAAFTIAHEIGHLLGLLHDDHEDCTKLSPNMLYIEKRVMAPTLDNGTHPWTWSKCSRDKLTQIFDAGQYKCLLSGPRENLLDNLMQPDNNLLLNQIPTFPEFRWTRREAKFTPDHLCELIFGPKARFCPGDMEVCRVLVCQIPGRMECTGYQMPWPDFTGCGHNQNQQCYHGQCVWINATHTDSIDGKWSAWTEWSKCSRTCGGGIRSSTRECNNPSPANGGSYCVGKRKQYESCNTHPCAYKNDFRAEQCARYNNYNYSNDILVERIEWIPRYVDDIKDRCKLICQVKNSDLFRYMGINVIDGTPCSPDLYDICVNGKCLPAGCDGKLYSDAKIDSCGVCGGDNSTCQEVSVQLNNVHVRYGYNTIVRIPQGAVNIDISETRSSLQDQHYLALRAFNGSYLINGGMLVSSEKQTIYYAGSKVDYSGSKERIERINSTKPIDKPFTLEILSGGDFLLPEIRYKYFIINDGDRNSRELMKTMKKVRAVAESTCTCKCDHKSKDLSHNYYLRKTANL